MELHCDNKLVMSITYNPIEPNILKLTSIS